VNNSRAALGLGPNFNPKSERFSAKLKNQQIFLDISSFKSIFTPIFQN